MKKLALIFGIVSLVAACNTIEEPSNIQDGTQEVKQVANAPVLSASLEEAAETKSYLNEADWNILWTANDEISAFVNRTINWKYRFAGATGDQRGSFNPIDVPEGGSSLDNVYAVYPYNSSNSINADGVMTVNFPAAQTYAAKTFGQGANTMVAAGASESNLVFKNACGFLMLKLYGTNVKVKSVSLKGKNNEKIAGAATVSMPLGGNPTVTMANSATDEIVLTCTNAVTIGNSSSDYTEFWFAIPPVTFSQGFTITVTTNRGTTFTKSNNNAFVVERGIGKKMAPIEVKVPTDLSFNETANCYIVNTAGTLNPLGYCFDCSVAGNGQEVNMAAKGFNTAANVWPQINGAYTSALPALHASDIRVTLNQNNCISNVTIDPTAGTISFEASGAKGNAKILVMDAANDDPAWVWHIWCTDQPTTVHYNSLHWTGWKYEVMDRNLGAIKAQFDDPTNANNNPDEICGFYYQFGNPTGWTWGEFSNGVADIWRMVDGIAGAEKYHRPVLTNGGNVSGGDFYWFNPYASSAPKQLFGILWGAGSAGDGSLKRGGDVVKTMYDPCPPGYQVMPIDMLDSVVNSNGGDQYGWYLTGTDGNIYFPYNGAAWAGGNFWMGRGYVPDGDTAHYTTMWTSGHNNINMAYCFDIYSKDVNRAGGGEIPSGGHILARGMGVRCVTNITD